MKKIIYFALTAIFLGTLHSILLDNSEEVARIFAIPYEGLSDEDARKHLIATCDRFYCNNYTPSDTSIALHHLSHFGRYVSEHVRPIQQPLEKGLNIFFSILYVILFFFTLRIIYRWIRADGMTIASGFACAISKSLRGILRKTGLLGFFSGHELKLAEQEFSRVKILFDNELITKEEFEVRKNAIREKIKSNKLV